MKKVILFAGIPGVGKSSLAGYLSWKFDLPILATDVIRSEVHQDTLSEELDVEEFNRRRDTRAQELVNTGKDFIYDGSIDRRWPEMKPKLEDAGYDFFIISFDLSDELADKLVKFYPGGWGKPPKEYKADHQKFLDDFSGDVSFKVTDENYQTRLEDALNAAKAWIEK